MAGTTGLEPATSAVTGQRSNQLSYVPRLFFNNLVICHIESSDSLFSLFSTLSLPWTAFGGVVDTKSATATTRSSLSETGRFGVHVSLSQREKVLQPFAFYKRRLHRIIYELGDRFISDEPDCFIHNTKWHQEPFAQFDWVAETVRDLKVQLCGIKRGGE